MKRGKVFRKITLIHGIDTKKKKNVLSQTMAVGSYADHMQKQCTFFTQLLHDMNKGEIRDTPYSIPTKRNRIKLF